jgi:Spy/CpxP family protein refolding chaperone
MRRVAFVLALGLAAAPAPALFAQGTAPNAPTEQPGQQGARRGFRDPVAQILDHRDDLKLTDDQVGKLQAIEDSLAAQRAPLMKQFEQFRAQRGADSAGPPSDQDRAAMRQRMEQMRPLMQQYRQQVQDAVKQAQAVLTPDQQAQARQYMQNMRRNRGGQDGQGGGY